MDNKQPKINSFLIARRRPLEDLKEYNGGPAGRPEITEAPEIIPEEALMTTPCDDTVDDETEGESPDNENDIPQQSPPAPFMGAAMTKRKRKFNATGQLKPIAADVIEHADQAADYARFQQYWGGSSAGTDWGRLSIADRLLERAVKKSRLITKVHDKLTNGLMATIERGGGLGAFHDTTKPNAAFRWSWHVWHHVIVGISKNIRSCNPNDCWFSSAHLNKRDRSTARPKYNFQVANVRKVDHDKYRNRFAYLGDQRFPEVQEVVARLVLAAFRGPGLDKQQASHLCHNVPQLCVNPNHLIWELAGPNLSRNMCVFGAAIFCPHEPKCVFTDLDGIYMPHRNDLSGEPCDCEGKSCNRQTSLME